MIDWERLAYKAGCDARIAGKRPHDNPYIEGDKNHYLFVAWANGWSTKDYEIRSAKRSR